MNATVMYEKCGKPLGVFDGNTCVDCSKIEQWQELKETIIELRNNNGTCTQQEVCKFLANLMDVLEKDQVKNELNVELNELRQESEE